MRRRAARIMVKPIMRSLETRIRPVRWPAALLVLAALAPFGGVRAQISPGPLSAAHEKLEGTAQCRKCHGAGSGKIQSQCLDCHQEIAWLIDRGSGLHARQEQDCSTCHPEHAGRDFDLVAWDEGSPEAFDHRRTGWELVGQHAALKCGDCHKPPLQVSPVADKIQKKNRSKSWLGLETDCTACHEDRHRGALGADCLKCHTTRKWKPAPEFDHAKTLFPLSGKHAEVECAKCHQAPGLTLEQDEKGRPVPLYKPLPHDDCARCHADPHLGALGATCVGCHVTTSFLTVDRLAFDHEKTRYPLRGKHRPLRCEQCHDPQKAWGKKPPFDRCVACHSDAHAGSATLAGQVVDCAACHNVEAFRPSTYTVTQHVETKYPLAGKHRDVECAKCHPSVSPEQARPELGSARVELRPNHQRCADCHRDAHGGQLSEREQGSECGSCHRVEGFKPSSYSIEDHAELRLGLVGRHAEVECAACHGPERKNLPPLPGEDQLGSARVAFAVGDGSCTACHLDAHDGRFEAAGEVPKPLSCVTCHGFEAFRPSSVGANEHAEFTYRLDGAHLAVPCHLCHEELTRLPEGQGSLLLSGATPRKLSFRKSAKLCRDCHESVHGAQFDDRPAGAACESCHDAESFRPAARFDHDRDSTFPLKGAHAAVPCAKCHPRVEGADGRSIVTYRPLARECRDCHVDRLPGMPPQGSN